MSFLIAKIGSNYILWIFEIDLLVYFCSFQEDDNETVNENDAELMKRIEKQRRRAVSAVRGGRKSLASRNSYKDKGGKSSNNSKIQKQLNNWWNIWSITM